MLKVWATDRDHGDVKGSGNVGHESIHRIADGLGCSQKQFVPYHIPRHGTYHMAFNTWPRLLWALDECSAIEARSRSPWPEPERPPTTGVTNKGEILMVHQRTNGSMQCPICIQFQARAHVNRQKH